MLPPCTNAPASEMVPGVVIVAVREVMDGASSRYWCVAVKVRFAGLNET